MINVLEVGGELIFLSEEPKHFGKTFLTYSEFIAVNDKNKGNFDFSMHITEVDLTDLGSCRIGREDEEICPWEYIEDVVSMAHFANEGYQNFPYILNSDVLKDWKGWKTE